MFRSKGLTLPDLARKSDSHFSHGVATTPSEVAFASKKALEESKIDGQKPVFDLNREDNRACIERGRPKHFLLSGKLVRIHHPIHAQPNESNEDLGGLPQMQELFSKKIPPIPHIDHNRHTRFWRRLRRSGPFPAFRWLHPYLSFSRSDESVPTSSRLFQERERASQQEKGKRQSCQERDGTSARSRGKRNRRNLLRNKSVKQRRDAPVWHNPSIPLSVHRRNRRRGPGSHATAGRGGEVHSGSRYEPARQLESANTERKRQRKNLFLIARVAPMPPWQ